MEELQHILKKPNTAHFIGQNALKSILQFLSQQQVSVEEYQEDLDLIDRFFSIKNASSHWPLILTFLRLIKTREIDAAHGNATIILSEASYVELLLDLLDHEDLTVGVMASQIMTELHSHGGEKLELQIQKCPDGQNDHSIISLYYWLRKIFRNE